jgi:hypothetical protein
MEANDVEQPVPVEDDAQVNAELFSEEPEDTESVDFDVVTNSEPEPQPEPQPDPISSELEEYKRRAIEAEARLQARQEIQLETKTAEQLAWDAEQERIRFEHMTPEERVAEIARQAEERVVAAVADSERRIADAQDKASFAEIVSKNPVMKEVSQEVEETYQREIEAGRNVKREDIAYYLAGKRFAQAGSDYQKPSPQKAQAAENIQNSEAKATSGGGDQKVSARTPVDEREARNDRLRMGKRRR